MCRLCVGTLTLNRDIILVTNENYIPGTFCNGVSMNQICIRGQQFLYFFINSQSDIIRTFQCVHESPKVRFYD